MAKSHSEKALGSQNLICLKRERCGGMLQACVMKLKGNPEPDDPLGLWLGKAAPRYTSYPPAPFFHANVTARDYAKSLANLAPGGAVSLYIHIPFCRSLCLYCGCNTMVTHRVERMQAYLAALKREIEAIAALTGRRRVSHLHFGGGTPNILGERDLRDLFDGLRASFDFGSVGEIAVELDPREVTQAQAQTLASCGVTRVSLGVQDFDAEVQEIIHRHQPYELVAQVYGWLQNAGIRRVNFDLIYGLPKQTPRTVADTAARVCALDPDRIALFSYAHVPQLKKHQKVLEEHGLPDIHERLVLEQTVREVLTNHGYHALGIDHFAKEQDPIMQARREDRLNRNFQGYTEDGAETLIGLGASSISQTAEGYFQNEHDERAYQSVVAAGRLPIRRGFLLSREDRLRRAIIEQMMCALSCDVEALCREHCFDIGKLDDDFDRLKPYEDAGIVLRRGHVVSLATPHRMAARVICKIFDDYSRHSQALSSRTA